ncbi:HalD/BesD family halogenase [Aliivibrio fischeri]|uniref:HalD/BesD family halogenase n=1 Tax=Aliivibrio fischeri TaxID=668 RepID=UPI003735F886
MNNILLSLMTELEEHISKVFTSKKIAKYKEDFSKNGYVKFSVGELVPAELFTLIQKECFELLEAHSIRRDVEVSSTGNSKRTMSNVTAQAIRQYGQVIDSIYNSAEIKGLLSQISQDQLVSCWEDEHYIINHLEQSGDTHGWHWGDYPSTLIWIIDAPSIEHGGVLQCIPHTTWNKSEPQIDQYIIDNPIYSYFHETGEVYFLKSDTTLHRVTPMKSSKQRIILNTCWGSKFDTRDSVEHETMLAAFCEEEA